MPKGFIGGLHMDTGQVLSEGNIYNFNIANVQGTVQNQQEIDFELDDNGNVKVIFGKGAKRVAPAPKLKSSKTKPKQKESGDTSNSVFDHRDFLTEEK